MPCHYARLSVKSRSMTSPVTEDHTLRPALESLSLSDPDLGRAFSLAGLPPIRRSDEGFSGLIRMIAGQQVSTASAAAIIRRLETSLQRVSAEAFLRLQDSDLKEIGFSRAKMRYGRALAGMIAAGDLRPEEWQKMEDDEVIAALTAVPGIGRWTAEIYLLFALGRPDVWPAGDLAVVKALMAVKGLEERPSEKELRRMAEAWRPHRSAAARLLWPYYRHAGLAL
ncbi:MAG: DNA-3-methyladenine glycosylase 2 family protein [Kiloniellales bacterium]|nr:DNA-3-methyladenine glycosylase 2 family protein [Kiloniellales bacterium]